MIRDFTVKLKVPELFVFHVSHVVIVSILKSLHNASAVPLLVFSRADESVDNCEDDADRGRYDLQLGLAFGFVTTH
jgi:hypothetical protein